MYPHLPDTFTGNRVGVESAVGFEPVGELVLEDGVCEHPARARQTTHSKSESSQRIFMRGIVTLERTEFNGSRGRHSDHATIDAVANER